MVEPVLDVVAEALQPRFLEEHDAVAGARQRLEDGADAEAVGAGEDAEIARAVPDGIGGARDVVGDGAADQQAADVRMQPQEAAADPAIEQRRADGDEAARTRVGVVARRRGG